MPQFLAIQVSRFGDLIHCLPMLRELCAVPAVELDVLVYDDLASMLAALPLRHIYTLRRLDEPELNLELQALAQEGRAPTLAAQILSALQARLPEYDAILNVDYRRLSGYLTRQLRARRREGMLLDERGRSYFTNPWCAFRYQNQLRSSSHRINLVDLWRGAARALMNGTAVEPPPPDARPPIPSPALSLDLPSEPKLALNPGAADLRRCWPVTSFARLAERLTAHGYRCLLVGAPGDRKLAEAIAKASAAPLLNLTGRTSPTEMVALLRQCRLLISNDTGAAHMAAAAGTPVIGLYSDILNYGESAPWSAGHLVLQRPCVHLILPGAPPSVAVVELAALYQLRQAELAPLQRQLRREGLHAWRTEFLPTGVDPLGGLEYLPLHGEGIDAEELLARILRFILVPALLAPRATDWPQPNCAYLIDLFQQRRLTPSGDLPAQAAGLLLRGQMLLPRLRTLHRLGICFERACRDGDASTARQFGMAFHDTVGALERPPDPSDALSLILLQFKKCFDSVNVVAAASAQLVTWAAGEYVLHARRAVRMLEQAIELLPLVAAAAITGSESSEVRPPR